MAARKLNTIEDLSGASRGYRIIQIRKPVKPSIDLKFVNGNARDEVKIESTDALAERMKNRRNLRNILLYSNATPIKFKDSQGYGCMYCPKQFPEAKNLKRHSLGEHIEEELIIRMANRLYEQVMKLDITLLNCVLCDKNLDNLSDLIAHLKSEHNKKMYTDVKSCLLPFKFDSSELRCSMCDNTYSSFKLLQEHMNVHYSNYVCETCGAGYVTETTRRRHMRSHDDGEYKCDKCEKIFTSLEKKSIHFRRTHLGVTKRNVCQFCDERFSDYWKKVDHMVKEHGMAPVVFKCQACDRTFNNQRMMNKHTKKDHLCERKHKCTECDMKFYDKSCLQRHMTKHTGLRRYQCDVCFKAYGQRQTLREHLRIHANDRRFACVHCGQTFVQKCSWKSHMKSKHAEIVT